MEVGRSLRTVFWALEGGPSVGIMNVTARLWWRTSRLANSIIGMRWPMPGVGIMATIAAAGGGGASATCSFGVTDFGSSIIERI